MFQPVKNKKVYEQIIEQIQERIVEGELKIGDQLPSERDLAEQFGVSRTSIREAMRTLEVIGLVESRQGGGNYIQANFEKSLMQPLSLMFSLHKSTPQDILSMRKFLEVEAAALAAKYISQSELKQLEIIIAGFQQPHNEITYSNLDKDFHYQIIKSSNNLLLSNILNVISSLIDKFIIDARSTVLDSTESRSLLNQQHENIFTAIKEHNAEKSSLEMKKHFEIIEKAYEKRNAKL